MSEPKPKTSSEARSKIGRLPFAQRQHFNRMVRDGYVGRELISWLADHGVHGVNPQNISAYKASRAFRDWLAEESDIERQRERTERMMRLADAVGGSASDKLKAILAGKLFSFAENLDDPAQLEDLVPAFTAVTQSERLQLQQRVVAQRDEKLSLEKARFSRLVCERLIDLHDRNQARDILDDRSLDRPEKIEALGKALFDDLWDAPAIAGGA